jgi:hypothetical protein
VAEDMRKAKSECEMLLRSEAGRFMLCVLQLCPTLASEPARLAAVTSFAYCG